MNGHELKDTKSYYLYRFHCECGATGLTVSSSARAFEDHRRHVEAVQAAAEKARTDVTAPEVEA